MPANTPLEKIRDVFTNTYSIDRELGRGGMATVYLAQDAKHERLVALKVLHPELAASLGPERFLREIKLAARLNHPHILPLHDSGETSGFLYYVMPYVEGESLRERLDRDHQLPDRRGRSSRTRDRFGARLCASTGNCPPGHQARERDAV